MIVVGSGAGGLAAALTAARAGLRTVVLERTQAIGGTSAMSGGMVYAPGSPLAAAAGQLTDRADIVRYLSAGARRPIDQALLGAFLDTVPAMVGQLADAGIALRLTGLSDYHQELPGAAAGHVIATQPFDPAELGELAPLIRRSPYRDSEQAPWTNGMSLIASLVAAATRAGAQIRTSCRVRRLLVEDGGVAGVVVDTAAGPADLWADHVVLASGGFEFNQALVKEWVGDKIEGSWSCPGNEGDGLLMATSAGARLTGLGEAQWYALLRLSDAELEGKPLYADASPARNMPGSIIVDVLGQRFADEAAQYQDFARALAAHRDGDGPAGWLIVDQAFVEQYGESSFGSGPLQPPHWLTAPTPADLARLIGVPPEALEATLRQFNESAADGLDPQFGRGEAVIDRSWGDSSKEGGHTCLAPLEQAPFHATRVYAGSSGTTGGPKIDPSARVVGADGTPVPGLYATGNVTAELFGDSSPGSGSTLGPAMTFGYLAGRTAAALARLRSGAARP